ncbi:MAG: thioesterase family protein [Desulfobacterales bacterium]|nr:thioesterase family protein [Desulfobacterales bacterium]
MNSGKNTTCEVNLTVPFHDLDPLQMVWHGNYIKYFDVARSALFNQAGIDLFHYFNRTSTLFPVTKTSVKFISSLRYLDEFKCTATVVQAQYKIVLDFRISLADGKKICAKGRSEQVAVKFPQMEILFEIPEDIRKALGHPR